MSDLLPGMKKVPVKVLEDPRGAFREILRTDSFGVTQINLSVSKRNVFRGLHMQLPPKAQGKLIQVTSGSIRDFVLDPDPRSDSFGNFCEVVIEANSDFALWIPGHYAHGFLSLQDNTVVVYGVDCEWSQDHELTINLFGSGIDHHIEMSGLIRSAKDEFAPTLDDLKNLAMSEDKDPKDDKLR